MVVRWIAGLLLFMMAVSALESWASSPAERLAGAIRFKTVSYEDRSLIDYRQFDTLLDYLRLSYPRVFDQLQVERVNGYSLLLRWPGSDPAARPVLFTGHLDVVPVEPGTESDWQHPAFAGVIADGRIYGRGTLDDKLGVMGLLEAAESLLAEGFSPRRTLVLAFGHDEEIGGREGAGKLAARMQELGLSFSWMVDEGGMLVSDYPLLPDRPVALVNIAEKGYLTLTLSATGNGGHSSNPPRVSSIGRLAGALARIENNPLPPRLVAPVEAMFEQLAPHLPWQRRLIFSNLWLTRPLVVRQMAGERLTQPFVRTTTALTMVNAGVKENVLPQRAEAKVNFRLLPGDTPETVVSAVRRIVDDPAIQISFDTWDNVPPVAAYQGGGYQVISDAVLTAYPEAVVIPSLLAATTDTRHYIDLADDQYRFHGVLIDTSQASSVHGTDEYVSVDAFNRSIGIAREMLRRGSE